MLVCVRGDSHRWAGRCRIDIRHGWMVASIGDRKCIEEEIGCAQIKYLKPTCDSVEIS